MTGKQFLTAEWRKLVMANYLTDPERLKTYLPKGTEPDLWNGKCYMSLVGFLFSHVRVKGMRIPFHTRFPEINLRFYVRYPDKDEIKRGVVFIREIVPKRFVTWMANGLYGERYMTLPMKYAWDIDPSRIRVSYQWKKAGTWNHIQAKADPVPMPLVNDSEEEFITEHIWGYTNGRRGMTSEYRVSHPSWDIYPVRGYDIRCDFEKIYGNDFSFLQHISPASVFLAEGSGISVFSKRVL